MTWVLAPATFDAKNGCTALYERFCPACRDCFDSAAFSEGYTPITLALSRNHLKMIRLLLERDFDVNRPDGAGRTVLAAAIEGTRDKSIVRTILNKGATVSQKELDLAAAANFLSLYDMVPSCAAIGPVPQDGRP